MTTLSSADSVTLRHLPQLRGGIDVSSLQIHLPTNADWDIHKAIITDLYLSEGLSLSGVRDVMKTQYGFNATMRMYKRRLTQWRLSKNTKQRDWDMIAKSIARRKEQGKVSEIYLSGKRLDPARVARSIKRNEEDRSRRFWGSPFEMSPEPGDHIDIRTPSPDPLSLRAPGHVQLSEEILPIVRDYVRNSFEKGSWLFSYGINFWTIHGSDQSDFALLNARRTIMLVSRASNSDPDNALRLLNTCLPDFESILRNESPLLLPFIFEMGYNLKDNLPVALALGKYITHVSKVVLGDSHPLTLIYEHAQSHELKNSKELLLSIYNTLLDLIIPRVGPDNLLVIRLLAAQILYSEGPESLQRPAESSSMRQHMAKRATETPFELTKIAFAFRLSFQSVHREGFVNAEQTLINLYETQGLYHAMCDHSDALSSIFMGSLMRSQQRGDAALRWYKKAKEITGRWGWDCSISECSIEHIDALETPCDGPNSVIPLSGDYNSWNGLEVFEMQPQQRQGSSQQVIDLSLRVNSMDLPGNASNTRNSAIGAKAKDHFLTNPSATPTKPNEAINSADLNRKAIQQISSIGNHGFGLILDDSRRLLVEWLAVLNLEAVDKQYQRLEALVRLLQSPDTTCLSGALRCRDVYYNSHSAMVGILYDLPIVEEPPVTLQQLLEAPQKQACPSLEDRFRFAWTLCENILKLHRAGWLHHNIHSGNVVFVSQKSTLASEIMQIPQLLGLGRSQPSNGNESNHRSSTNDYLPAYQHPDLRGESGLYQEECDYYSLGLILLEIGLWRSWTEMIDSSDLRGSSKENIRINLIHVFIPRLRTIMGTKYMEATLSCVDGSLNANNGADMRTRQKKWVFSQFETRVLDRILLAL